MIKKHILSIVLILCILSTVRGQTHKTITISLNENDFTLVQQNGCYSIESTCKPIDFDTDTLSPALPWLGVTVLIGRDDVFNSVSIHFSHAFTYSEVNIRPNYKLVRTDDVDTYPNYSKTPNYHESSYPSTSVIYTGTHYLDGYKLLTFQVCPFEYSPSKKVLTLYNIIHLDIELTKESDNRTPSHHELESTHCDSEMIDVVRSLAMNGEDIFELYPISTNNISNRDASDSISYLIITNEQMKPQFQVLADWKTQKGIKTEVITKEYIMSHYQSGASPALKIKRAIKDYKDYYGTKYVLLGGDREIIPTVYCVIQYDTIVSYTPCDLFYACLTQMSWDQNQNGEIGEIADNIDTTPSIYLSRISVINSAEAEGQVNRIIEYEKNPKINSWENKMLMCGVKIDTMKIMNGRLASDVEIIGDIIFNDSISPLWNGTRFRLYDTRTDEPLDAAYQVTVEHLADKISEGYNFIHVDTHGSYNLWKMEVSDSFNTSDASQIMNSGNSLIITSACHTNNFSYPICLSEAFMRNPNSGIIGYWGSSNSGWAFQGSFTPGPSDKYNTAFYHHLFTQKEKNLGKIAFWAKMQFISRLNYYGGIYRWLHFAINILGDPEMPIFTQKPQEFDNVTFTYNNSTLAIDTHVDSCRVCVMSKNNGVIDYYMIKDNIRQDTVLNTPLTEDYSICVTKPGYIPYIVYVMNQECIQNETIAENRIYISDNTFIGRNVTSSVDNGPVSVEDGKIIIYSQHGATIKNSFEVKKGATLEIK